MSPSWSSIPLRQHASKYPFVVIEGSSGVGKTTAAKLLARHLEGVYLHGPPDQMDELRSLVERPGDLLRPLFYALGNALCARQAEELLQYSPVILDRYVYTTVAWHLALGLETDLPWSQLDLLQPDLAVVLTADESLRLRRLYGRDAILSETDLRRDPEAPSVHKAYIDALLAFGLTPVETDFLTAEEVAARVAGLVAERANSISS